MPQERAEGCQRTRGGGWIHAMGVSPIKRKQDWKKPFQEIQDEDRIAPLLTEHAKHIGRPDITASLGTDIDAAESSGKKSEGDRSQEIRTESDQKPGNPRLENHPAISSVW